MARSRDISKVLSSNTTLATDAEVASTYQTKALNQFPNRNIIINGDMQIAQRGTSVSSVTSGGYLTADRWNEGITTQGTWTISVENDAPTGSGFRKSLKWLCTTADASPAAGDNLQFFTTLEGQNLQTIKKGTAAAEQLTLSFWVKSNVTGTYVAELYDNDNTRQTSKQYTISASGVWEYKTITFAADTTGAFDNDNALSLYAIFGLGAGSNFTSGTLQTSWASATTANRFVGQVNVASATNNYWQVTGIQLEVGATATPFEFKTFAQSLIECQRYYQKSYAQGTNPGTALDYAGLVIWSSITTGAYGSAIPIYLKTTMRATPTVTIYNPETGATGSIRGLSAGTNFAGTAEYIGQNSFAIYATATQSPAGYLIGAHYVAVIEL
jgi:hypothetical protein